MTKRGVTSELFTNVLIHFGSDSEDNSLVSIYKAADWAQTGGKYYSFSSSAQTSLPITFKITAIVQIYRMGTHRTAIMLKNANYIVSLPDSHDKSLANYISDRQAKHEIKLRLNKQEINFEHEQKLWAASLFAHPHVDPMVQNWHRGKVVLDVVVGLPVMAIEAAKFGASKVYVVRPNSKMARIAQKLIDDNSAQTEDGKWKSRIKIIVGDISSVQPRGEGIDLIFTEAVGVTQYYEQVYKINIHAARWLKKDGVLLPSETKFFIAPFTDEAVYDELQSKANFWSDSVSVTRLKSLYNDVKNAIFSRQFRIDSDIADIKMAKENQFRVTFSEDNINYDNIMSMQKEFSLKFLVKKDGYIHGLVFWFDATFMTEKYMPSSSSKLYLQNRLETKKGDTIIGKVVLSTNDDRTYDLTIELMIEGKPQTKFIQLVNLEEKYEF